MGCFKKAQEIEKIVEEQTFPNNELDTELFLFTIGVLAATNPNNNNEFSVFDVIAFYNIIVNQENLIKVLFFQGHIGFHLEDFSLKFVNKEETTSLDELHEITLKYTLSTNIN